MTAELLREAAAVLRELADDADDGWPWKSEGSFVDTDPECGFNAGTSRLSAYIATMHPGVGLALADWLEAVAVRCDLGRDPKDGGARNHGWRGSREASKVARAILGRDA